jgi:hypothetical protein
MHDRFPALSTPCMVPATALNSSQVVTSKCELDAALCWLHDRCSLVYTNFSREQQAADRSLPVSSSNSCACPQLSPSPAHHFLAWWQQGCLQCTHLSDLMAAELCGCAAAAATAAEPAGGHAATDCTMLMAWQTCAAFLCLSSNYVTPIRLISGPCCQHCPES